jgi:hypothetical protein
LPTKQQTGRAGAAVRPRSGAPRPAVLGRPPGLAPSAIVPCRGSSVRVRARNICRQGRREHRSRAVRVDTPLHGVAPSGSDDPSCEWHHTRGQLTARIRASRKHQGSGGNRLPYVWGRARARATLCIACSAGFQVPRLGKAFDRSVFSASLDASLHCS